MHMSHGRTSGKGRAPAWAWAWARAARAALALGAAAAVLLGCATERAPTFEIVEATLVEAGGEAAVVRFVVRGENRNEFELPLRGVDYSVSVSGARLFGGTREAQVTLPRFGVQFFELPAAIRAEEVMARVAEYDGEPLGGWLIGRPASVRGRVVYESEGSIAEVLFDTKLRVPEASFAGEAVIEAGEAVIEDGSAGVGGE